MQLAFPTTAMPTIIAQRLTSLRGKTSQSEIARIAGVAATTISNWENDVTVPPADSIAKLAKHWQVSADYLVGISEHPSGFPPHCWVVDLDFVEALKREDGSHAKLGDRGAFAIPSRMQILSSVEYQALEAELHHLIKSPSKGRRAQT